MSSLGLKDVDFGEHGVIYITSETDRPLSTEWKIPATAELLRILPKQFDLFNNGKLPSKRRLFDNCAALMEKKGFHYKSTQCENKWKSLKRRYLTKHEKMLTGRPWKGGRKFRQMFDNEIEAILKIEKPSFRREMDEISKINLNIPPGFEQMKEEEEEDDDDDTYEEYEEADGNEYTQNDERLVEMVLKDSNSMDEESPKEKKHKVLPNNIEYLYANPEDEEAEHSVEEKYVPNFKEHSESSETLVNEVKELRKVVKRSLEANTEILKTHNATHEQLLICLDTLDKREEEKLELKKRKLEKQGELLQQVKIQNSLIAKLIQKIGNNGVGSTR